MHNPRATFLAAALIAGGCTAHAEPAPPALPAGAIVAPTRKPYPQPAYHGRFCVEEAQATFHGRRYFGCSGKLVVLDAATDKRLASVALPMQGIHSIEPAGPTAIAVTGWIDGAALRNSLVFLRLPSFRMLTGAANDNSYLGTIDDRIYVNDYCCNGRGDEYRPATIYSVSSLSGSATPEIDLRPDNDIWTNIGHGVGEFGDDYLIGHYLYVPVRNITYRYDITDLRKPFVRMRTPKS